jgi:hypothetical protein
LKRVLLNLVMNELEAIAAIAIRPPELGVESRIGGNNPLRYAAGLAPKQIHFSSFHNKGRLHGNGSFDLPNPKKSWPWIIGIS